MRLWLSTGYPSPAAGYRRSHMHASNFTAVHAANRSPTAYGAATPWLDTSTIILPGLKNKNRENQISLSDYRGPERPVVWWENLVTNYLRLWVNHPTSDGMNSSMPRLGWELSSIHPYPNSTEYGESFNGWQAWDEVSVVVPRCCIPSSTLSLSIPASLHRRSMHVLFGRRGVKIRLESSLFFFFFIVVGPGISWCTYVVHPSLLILLFL